MIVSLRLEWYKRDMQSHILVSESPKLQGINYKAHRNGK